MHTQQRRKIILCSLLLCLNLIFIWGNSALPGRVSGQISESVMKVAEKILMSPLFEKTSVRLINFINSHLDLAIPNEDVGEHLLRKMAHFTEFCWLGVTLTWFYLILDQRGLQRVMMPLFSGLAAACIDETIQLYSPGRGSSLVDVWIDTAGVAAGVAVFLICYYCITFKKRKSKSQS